MRGSPTKQIRCLALAVLLVLTGCSGDHSVLAPTGEGVDTMSHQVQLVTLRPNGPGTFTEWNKVGAPANWVAVADPGLPDFSFVLHSVIGTTKTDSYELENPPAHIGLPRRVIIHARIQAFGQLSNPKLGVVIGGVWYQAGTLAISPAWPAADYELEFATNPATGEEWKQVDLISLQAAHRLTLSNIPGHRVQVFKVWVEAEYEIPHWPSGKPVLVTDATEIRTVEL